MLELPEAVVISGQLAKTIKGKRIKEVVTAASPHKFAWYYEEPSEYEKLLCGRTIENAFSYGGRIEMPAEDAVLHFGDGVNLRYYEADEKRPAKHQLLVGFDDGSALTATVAMYGMLFAYPPHTMDDDFYVKAAKEAISPLSNEFDFSHFQTLFDEKWLKKSAKAFLATEQRIPGLGNGVLQDILLNAKVHPKKKMNTLSEEEHRQMFDSVKSTLAEMTVAGGRDTERDLFGNSGGYKTKLGKNNKLLICPNCGGAAKKESYMGGSIYFCEQCQKL